MDGDYISRQEHKEFAQRIDQENHRQNERIRLLEDNVRQIGTLTTSVEKLATNMESMLREQEQQGKKLEVLEGRDGDRWRTAVSHVVTAIIGAVVGYIFTMLGM